MVRHFLLVVKGLFKLQNAGSVQFEVVFLYCRRIFPEHVCEDFRRYIWLRVTVYVKRYISFQKLFGV